LTSPYNSNGCAAAKETTMKRFLQSVFAILKKTNKPKSVAAPKPLSATPLLEVRSQVKAGVALSFVRTDVS
jgi:hypothetical protein